MALLAYSPHPAFAQPNLPLGKQPLPGGILTRISQNPRKDSTSTLPKESFAPGELLRYEVRYSFAKCAQVEFTTTDTVANGKRLFHHRISGYTTGLIHKLYSVSDVYHSYTDPSTDLPLRAIRNVHEQKYRDYKVDLYDRTPPLDSAIVTRENGQQVKVPLNTHCVVSVAYYIRNRLSTMKLKEGSSLNIPLYFNAEFYPMKIRYTGQELVKTKFGKVLCYRFKPQVREGDLFKDQDALTVWISTDDNHLPVRIKFELFLGAMYCDLIGYKGLQYEMQVTR